MHRVKVALLQCYLHTLRYSLWPRSVLGHHEGFHIGHPTQDKDYTKQTPILWHTWYYIFTLYSKCTHIICSQTRSAILITYIIHNVHLKNPCKLWVYHDFWCGHSLHVMSFLPREAGLKSRYCYYWNREDF